MQTVGTSVLKGSILRFAAMLSAPFMVMSGSPLVRNGYALVASSAATSILGVVFWIVAARLYPQDQLGLGSVLVTTLVALSSASQLGFGNILNRFLPAAGFHSGRLILIAFAVGLSASVMLSGAFLLASPFIAPDLAFMREDGVLALWFVAAAGAWTVFALQDSALAGLRHAAWVPIENTLYALTKLLLLIASAQFFLSGLGLFAAWTAPLLFMIAGVNILIVSRILPTRTAHPAADLVPRRVLTFLGWDYAGGLALTAALGLAPLIVLNHAGPAGIANYHLSWTVTYSLYLIGRSMGISLLTEGVGDRTRLRALAADAFVYTMLPLSAAALMVALMAPMIMAMFGASYASEGAAVLSVLALSSIPWSAVTLHLALARAKGHLRTIFVVQTATLLVVASLGMILVAGLGPLGMALAWLAAHSAVLAGIVLRSLLQDGPDGALLWLLGTTAALGRLVGAVRPPPERNSYGDTQRCLAETLTATRLPGASSWRASKILSTLSDTTVAVVGSPDRPEAVLKVARSPLGVAALERGIANLEHIARDPRLADCRSQLPPLLAVHRLASQVSLLEGFVEGRDGRAALLDPVCRARAFSETARVVGSLHRLTQHTNAGEVGWMEHWIDRPIARLADCANTFLPIKQRVMELERIGQWQRRFWTKNGLPLGLAHGDMSPGNLIFSESGDLRAILDWETAQWDAPQGFDLCHFAMTSRVLVTGQEFGAVASHLLTHPEWAAEEISWLGADDTDPIWLTDPGTIKAIVGFTWLQHLANNIDKAHRYSRNRLWIAANLDWVLRQPIGDL